MLSADGLRYICDLVINLNVSVWCLLVECLDLAGHLDALTSEVQIDVSHLDTSHVFTISAGVLYSYEDLIPAGMQVGHA